MENSRFNFDRALEVQLNKKIIDQFSKLGADIQYPVEGSNGYNQSTDMAGVDVIFSLPSLIGVDGYKKFDLKSATSWVADSHKSGLSTFAFELIFINASGNVRDGWLFGKQYSETEYYSLQWLWKKPGVNKRYIDSVEEIGKVETLVVSKTAVQDYARSLNITERNYRNLSKWLASKVQKTERYYDKSGTKIIFHQNKSELNLQPNRLGNYARLVCSKNLQECPVNLLIPKDDLINIAGEKSYFSYKI